MTEENPFRKTQRENCRSCTIWLNCDIIAALDEHANETDQSATEIVEAALAEYLDITSECNSAS